MQKKFSTIYIHVGPDKTGSTYLQNIFSANREVLERNNIYYPSGYSHPLIGSAFNDDSASYVYNLANDRTDRDSVVLEDFQYIEKLKSEFDLTRADRVFISYEGLATCSLTTHQRIKEFLHEYTLNPCS